MAGNARLLSARATGGAAHVGVELFLDGVLAREPVARDVAVDAEALVSGIL